MNNRTNEKAQRAKVSTEHNASKSEMHPANTGVYDKNVTEMKLKTRNEARIRKWRNLAGFPWYKTIQEFDFTKFNPSIKSKLVELSACDWIKKGWNIALCGKLGGGRTGLSIALGSEAISTGYTTRFVTLTKLAYELNVVESHNDGLMAIRTKRTLLNKYTNVDLLILDSIDDGKSDDSMSTFLFYLLCERYDARKSTLFTCANVVKAFEHYVLPDRPVMAAALLDRICEQCKVVKLIRQSKRDANQDIEGAKHEVLR